MSGFIENAILWTLALYGLFEIIKTIMFFYTYKGKDTSGINLIIAVKDQENNIEGFIRAIIFKIIYGKEEMIREIVVTDLNSHDRTKEILIRLAEDYECVKFIDINELDEFSINTTIK